MSAPPPDRHPNLTEQNGLQYAVIVNEFGEEGIDNDPVVYADDEVFEMNKGCICCTVRGDLIRILGGLMKRADQLDAIIVQTTGLADPAAVAQTFFVDQDVADRTKLDAIVTVADAVHFKINWANTTRQRNKWLKPRVPEGCVIHSFRHSLRDRLRAVQCSSDIIAQIDGRATAGVRQNYGEGYSLRALIEKLYLLRKFMASELSTVIT